MGPLRVPEVASVARRCLSPRPGLGPRGVPRPARALLSRAVSGGEGGSRGRSLRPAQQRGPGRCPVRHRPRPLLTLAPDPGTAPSPTCGVRARLVGCSHVTRGGTLCCPHLGSHLSQLPAGGGVLPAICPFPGGQRGSRHCPRWETSGRGWGPGTVRDPAQQASPAAGPPRVLSDKARGTEPEPEGSWVGGQGLPTAQLSQALGAAADAPPTRGSGASRRETQFTREPGAAAPQWGAGWCVSPGAAAHGRGSGTDWALWVSRAGPR